MGVSGKVQNDTTSTVSECSLDVSWTKLTSNPLTINQVSERELKYQGLIEEIVEQLLIRVTKISWIIWDSLNLQAKSI